MIDMAIKAAIEGGKLASSYFKNIPKVSFKGDKSPITKADIETEKLIRHLITHKFPNHGIIGEEFKQINPKAQIQWIIDPIDGTRDFVRGIPFWSVLVAVLKNNKPIIGIEFLPAIDEMYIAQIGKGTFLNDKRMHVSKVKDLKNAYISHGSIKRFDESKNLTKLLKVCKSAATDYSCRNLGFKFLLEGKMDILLETYGNIYDFAAPAILTSEAGGSFSDFSGKNSLTSGNAVFTNGLLHKQVINILNS